MTEKPILFSAPMVRALLDGRKTQTRRTLKPLPNRTVFFNPLTAAKEQFQAPRFAVGDRLWVREAWRCEARLDKRAPRDIDTNYPGVKYIATDEPDSFGIEGKYRQAMHMPRWASRLTLIVTDVRVERLQDISESDARAEGCPVTWDGKPYDPPPPEVDSWRGYGRYSYCLLWSKINGPGSWDANPWVAAYTFTVIKNNIDQVGREA